MHELLAEVVEGIAHRSSGAWRPAFGRSPARQEAEAVAVLPRSDGVTAWGTAPIEVVWKASELLYVAAIEHARAAAHLLVPPFRTWAPSAEVRAAVEAAAQAAWLFDPKVPSGRARVGRYYTLRLNAARQLVYTVGKVNAGGPLSDYGAPPAAIEAEAASLALTPVVNKNNNVIGYEGYQAPKIDNLVQLIVGNNGAYSVLSGSAHSEFWWLLGGYHGQPPSPHGVTADQHEEDSESFVPLVRACLQALLKPIDNACMMFERPALANDLDRLYANVVRIMGE